VEVVVAVVAIAVAAREVSVVEAEAGPVDPADVAAVDDGTNDI